MTLQGHHLRTRILQKLEATADSLSTQQLGSLLQEKPATINYHLGVLVDRGQVERASTQTKRNASEHFYRLALGEGSA